jgi:protein ImuB
MKRIVSVWLPDWPITAWPRRAGRAPPDPGLPFALVDRRGNRGLVLHALNGPARALGLLRGQSHADARAIATQLVSAPCEPEQEAVGLERLALWAERYSPCVAVDPAPAFEGLFLDLTGGAHLFGGDEALLREIEARLARACVPAHAAIADSPGAAWALARYSSRRIAAPGETRNALSDLPVEALRLEEEALRLLRRFGLKRIGDLYGLPRSGLARRFRGKVGLDLVRRLDQTLGVEGEPLRPVRPAPLYRTWQSFVEPLIEIESVGHMLPALAEALAAQLERDGKGARRIRLTAFRTDGRATAIEAGLSAPSARAPHLLRLLREKGLERLDLGFGADALMLEALKAEARDARQGDFARDRQTAAADALCGLVDRIEAKLGDGAVRHAVLADSHVPERSEGWAAEPSPAPVTTDDRPRPLFLFDPPEPIETVAELPDGLPARFIWRRVARKVSRAEGPERISPEWWRQPNACRPERTRDYYRVEDETGRRYWLFREGLYGREDSHLLSDGTAESRPPSWWLHGVFP